MSPLATFYERMFFIRRFEETLLDLFSLGKLVGTTHTYIGQEANAVGSSTISTPAATSSSRITAVTGTTSRSRTMRSACCAR